MSKLMANPQGQVLMHAAMMGTDLEPKQLTEPPITKEKFMEVFKFQMATMKKYTPKMQAMQI